MIIDASVGVKWLIAEEDTPAAIGLLDLGRLHVPVLFLSEVGNALIKKARRGEIVLAEMGEAYATLPKLVTVIDESAVVPRALDLATVLNHGVYDCVYLALAEKTDNQLVTADRKFVMKLDDHELRTRVTHLGDLRD